MNQTDPRDRRPQRIAMLPGDGIGKDVTAEAVKALEAAAEGFGLPLELVHLPWDADRYLATGESLPPGALEDFRDNWAAIFIGAYGDPRVPDMKHAADILLGIRFGLDLYINLRPIKLYDARYCPLKERPTRSVGMAAGSGADRPAGSVGVAAGSGADRPTRSVGAFRGVPASHPGEPAMAAGSGADRPAGGRERDIDIVVFRENTEGAYVNVGGNFKRGTPDEIAVQEEIHTRKGVERILRAAFDYAVAHGRRQVLMSDKSNVMRYGHEIWQRCFREVAADYPQIEARHMFVDALAMQMVLHPENLDVIVTNNMFGDIITDLGAALQGGLGVAASANLHPGRTSMFEPVHGSAPKYAGTGRANPVGAILSAALMLDTLGHAEAARTIEEAVAQSLRQGQTTVDLGGSLTTSQVGDLLARTISDRAPAVTRSAGR